MAFQRLLDIRYTGQEFSIPVPIPAQAIDQGNVDAIQKAFNELHERRYGYHTPEQPVEIVNVRVSAVGRRKKLEFPSLRHIHGQDPLVTRRDVYLENSEKAMACPIYRRERLGPGAEVMGPAVIQEYACTIILFPRDRAVVAETGEIVIHIAEAADGR